MPLPAEGLVLHPGQLYLGRRREQTKTSGLVPRVQGRSSLTRLGLIVCPGASLGEAVTTAALDPGDVRCPAAEDLSRHASLPDLFS